MELNSIFPTSQSMSHLQWESPLSYHIAPLSSFIPVKTYSVSFPCWKTGSENSLFQNSVMISTTSRVLLQETNDRLVSLRETALFLASLVWSRWRNIGLVLFCFFLTCHYISPQSCWGTPPLLRWIPWSQGVRSEDFKATNMVSIWFK